MENRGVAGDIFLVGMFFGISFGVLDSPFGLKSARWMLDAGRWWLFWGEQGQNYVNYWGAGDYEFIQYLLCVLLAILSKKYTGKDIKKLHIEKAILLKICAMIMLFIIPNMNFGKLTNLIRLARINSVLMNFSYRWYPCSCLLFVKLTSILCWS